MGLKTSVWAAWAALLAAGAAGASGLSPTAAALQPEAHYYSTATLGAFAWGSPGRPLPAALFLDGRLVGTSPVNLSRGVLVDKPGFALEAQLDGYEEALRPSVALPREGEVKVAMAPLHPGAWYSIPGICLGLGLAAAGFVAAGQGGAAPGAGTALIAAGAGLIGVSYAVSWFQKSSVDRAVRRYNDSSR